MKTRLLRKLRKEAEKIHIGKIDTYNIYTINLVELKNSKTKKRLNNYILGTVMFNMAEAKEYLDIVKRKYILLACEEYCLENNISQKQIIHKL